MARVYAWTGLSIGYQESSEKEETGRTVPTHWYSEGVAWSSSAMVGSAVATIWGSQYVQ
jgi:hypothetical protein